MEFPIKISKSLQRFFAKYPKYKNNNLNDAVGTIVSLLSALDIDLLMLNLTQPDVGLPVVKMIAPSLRHFWRRLAPGRLYDVPVKMGWLEQPLRESELNDLSIVI